ncbi:hypothetical protein N494_12915 [Clostridium botulinum A2B7 92]|uniref:hypothetical protein n=1 Tax=Clostridium botulinum TaxID=1491 RepID=UPI0007E24F3D|nr:hypothetical protein [Clostridium botulinum]KEI97160.1 hypothetical protein N494_12915 [Clostridium botulinum A2B7 92]
MKRLKKEICIFEIYGFENQIVSSIVQEAKKRGYSIKFTQDINYEGEIGIYSQHYNLPKGKKLHPKSKLSIILLHDMLESHSNWPNMWRDDPWNEFDIAILPGNEWLERWSACQWHENAQPRIGVFSLGWPKADHAFMEGFMLEKIKFKEKYKFKYEKTVFYAPSYELDSKQNDVVESLRNLPVNIIIKHAPSKVEPDIYYKNIKEMNSLHKDKWDNVYILDSWTDIMLCFDSSDLIISDESSVILEGVLFNIPSISVKDWKVGFEPYTRNPIIPYNFVYQTTKDNLETTVENILLNIEKEKEKNKKLKNNFYNNIGVSGIKILDVIDEVLNSNINNFMYYKKDISDSFGLEAQINKAYNDLLTNEEKKVFEETKNNIFDCCRYLINNNLNNKIGKYVIWGAGSGGSILYKILKYVLPNAELIMYVDTFKNGKLNNIEINKVHSLKDQKTDYIFIATLPGKSFALQKLYDMKLLIGEDFYSVY